MYILDRVLEVHAGIEAVNSMGQTEVVDEQITKVPCKVYRRSRTDLSRDASDSTTSQTNTLQAIVREAGSGVSPNDRARVLDRLDRELYPLHRVVSVQRRVIPGSRPYLVLSLEEVG